MHWFLAQIVLPFPSYNYLPKATNESEVIVNGLLPLCKISWIKLQISCNTRLYVGTSDFYCRCISGLGEHILQLYPISVVAISHKARSKPDSLCMAAALRTPTLLCTRSHSHTAARNTLLLFSIWDLPLHTMTPTLTHTHTHTHTHTYKHWILHSLGCLWEEEEREGERMSTEGDTNKDNQNLKPKKIEVCVWARQRVCEFVHACVRGWSED